MTTEFYYAPKRFRQAYLSNYETTTPAQTESLGMVKRWVRMILDGQYGNLILMGGVGTGKTHIACGCLQAFYGHRLKAFEPNDQFVPHDQNPTANLVRYITAAQYINEIQATFETKESAEAVRRKYRKVELLVIDELGVGSDSSFSRDEIGRLIDYRYTEMKPTIFVSNLMLSELDKHLDERSRSRMIDGLSVTVGCDWPGYRQQGKETHAKQKLEVIKNAVK